MANDPVSDQVPQELGASQVSVTESSPGTIFTLRGAVGGVAGVPVAKAVSSHCSLVVFRPKAGRVPGRVCAGWLNR